MNFYSALQTVRNAAAKGNAEAVQALAQLHALPFPLPVTLHPDLLSNFKIKQEREQAIQAVKELAQVIG